MLCRLAAAAGAKKHAASDKSFSAGRPGGPDQRGGPPAGFPTRTHLNTVDEDLPRYGDAARRVRVSQLSQDTAICMDTCNLK